jgi:choline dehydrogenase-like flavoprotein
MLAFHTVEVNGTINDRTTFESDTAALELAAAHWDHDQSGAFALHHSTLYGGFHKLPGLEDSKEYHDLPDDVREFLAKDKVPHYEFVSNGLLYPPGTPITPGNSYMTFIAVLLNPQSEGSVTLRSSNAADKPVIQLNYMTHPYDRIAFRQAIRATWEKLVENPGIKPHVRKTLLGPKSLSDADIDAFVGDNAGTVWHANGTVRMGECVDSAGRMYGVKGLRVADLSVCPVVTNNHTQSTAYLVGATVAGKIVKEYGLDGR